MSSNPRPSGSKRRDGSRRRSSRQPALQPPATAPPRVSAVVADFDKRARSATVAVLKACAVEVVAETEDADGTIEAVKRYRPSLAILDIVLPPDGGMPLLARIRSHCAQTRVIVFTEYTQGRTVSAAMSAGALCYIDKREGVESWLPQAIEPALNGRNYYSPEAATAMTRQHEVLKAAQRTEVRLSPREIEAVKCRAASPRLKDCADSMHVCVKTVQKHLTSARRKLKVSGNAELVLHAVKEGWITP